METRVSIAAEERVAATGMQAARDIARPTYQFPAGGFSGDRIDVTVGKECFYPVKYQGFEVGPVSFSTTLGPGEDLATAYARASTVAHAMFEAEYQMKRTGYWQRLGEVTPK